MLTVQDASQVQNAQMHRPAGACNVRLHQQDHLLVTRHTLDALVVLDVQLVLLLLVPLQILIGCPGALGCCLVAGPLGFHLHASGT